jgi:hypothetical protein
MPCQQGGGGGSLCHAASSLGGGGTPLSQQLVQHTDYNLIHRYNAANLLLLAGALS